jgi:hypothetical protein
LPRSSEDKGVDKHISARTVVLQGIVILQFHLELLSCPPGV